MLELLLELLDGHDRAGRDKVTSGCLATPCTRNLPVRQPIACSLNQRSIRSSKACSSSGMKRKGDT